MIFIDNKNFNKFGFEAVPFNGKIEIQEIDYTNTSEEKIAMIIDQSFEFKNLPDIGDNVITVFEVNNLKDLNLVYAENDFFENFKTIMVQEDIGEYILERIKIICE